MIWKNKVDDDFFFGNKKYGKMQIVKENYILSMSFLESFSYFWTYYVKKSLFLYQQVTRSKHVKSMTTNSIVLLKEHPTLKPLISS